MISFCPIPTRILNMCDTRNFFGNAAGCRLFMNERDSDISICVESEEIRWRFPAHRLVLSTMSDVFRTMFDTDMLEKSNGEIIIKDSKALTVKQFLKYLYMGAVDFTNWMEAVDLLKIAHKYGVHTLTVLLENHLTTTLSLSNVCYLHDLAQTYSLNELKKHTTNLILDAAFIVSATDGFHRLQPKCIEYLLSSSKLNMENECSVLATLKEWAVVECSRRGMALTRQNILDAMEPYMNHIRWDMIPEELRTYIPRNLVERYNTREIRRKTFYVPSCLQFHISVIKFMVELGTYYEQKYHDDSTLSCLKFGVDNHAFIVGFRILGKFRIRSTNSLGPSMLILSRDDSRMYIQFNLNSLPWNKGATVGDYMWRELTAYLPYPVRVNPFSTYVISLKNTNRPSLGYAKWPSTRLDLGVINSDFGPINFRCYSECYGIAQLFVLPAPPVRNVCNDIDG